MFMKSKKRFFNLALIIACFYGCDRLSHKYMRGFSYHNFTIMPPPGYEINHKAHGDIDHIISQPFSFLGYGGESLVFESCDKEFVLKVFKKHRLYPYFELGFIKYPAKIFNALKSRQKVYYRFWDSLKLQAEKCSELSMLRYIHLPSDKKKLSKITLIDPCGSKHSLDLNDICFVIQKKGELFESVYLKTTSLELRKQMLQSVLDLYFELAANDLYIWDNAIYRNLGWMDHKPFLIDTGSIRKNPSLSEMLKNLNDLKAWVLKNDKDSYNTLLDLIASHQASNTF